MSKRSGVHFRIDQPLKPDADDGSTIRHTIKANKVEKFSMKQTKLITTKDKRDIAKGKYKDQTFPPRAIKVQISFIIPEDECARQRAQYDKFLKRQQASR